MKVHPEINKFVEQNGLNQKELMGGKVPLRSRETEVLKIAAKLGCGGHKLVARFSYEFQGIYDVDRLKTIEKFLYQYIKYLKFIPTFCTIE